MSVPADASTEGLFFSSLNPLAPITIVLLHALMGSHLEWAHCWPKLSEYHLLIPDLPQHSRSRHVGPFSYLLSADLIAKIIRDHAHDGRAHVVGVSAGGYVALELVRRHPDTVLSAFVSGAAPLEDFWKSFNSQPKIAQIGLSVILHSPRSVMTKATGWAPELRNDELVKEMKRNNTARLYETGCREAQNWTRENLEEVGRRDKRIALVASRHEKVEHIQEMARVLGALGSDQGQKTRAFLVKDAIQAWNLQNPQLFARGIRAWAEKMPMPMDYEPLEGEAGANPRREVPSRGQSNRGPSSSK
ncbi:alpha/beta-hydrolase [Durotheca rogersii]|uniref:alpha/beta-hydrolase n=1 Tax=Durotheca rogersii TaxID=419775 RepID=UPI00221E3C09|nr:alpha/beta-hydrolase [Durotheca rogersii]KAI5863621.1 alpha/beta-hydrolase [Durotheca rogersii]